MLNKLKNLKFELLSIVIFIAIAFAYCSPVLSGKRLLQGDQVQGNAAAQEILNHAKATGNWSWWTNSMFSGMPSYMIQSKFENSYINKFAVLLNNFLPSPVNMLFWMMLSMFILLRVMKFRNLVATFGAIAFAFSSYNMIYLEAGHVSKIMALSFVPLIIAGIMLCYQKNYLFGSAITAFGLGFELYANHLQVTYYSFFIIGGIVLFNLIESFKTGWFRGFVFGSIAALIGLGLGIGSNTARMWSSYEYAKETIRGKSDLTPKDAKENKADGLDKSYAFYYSHGIDESLTFFTPSFKGGKSGGSVDKKSDTYKTLISLGVDPSAAEGAIQSLPMYAGSQPDAAPQYMGAIICFLALLGLFVSKNNIKWVFFGISILFIILSWGSNFEVFNYLMFDYFPFYNKFRAVNQILILAHFSMVILAVMALEAILEIKPTLKEISKPILYTTAILFGIVFIGWMTNNLSPASDTKTIENLTQSFGNNKQAAEQMMASIVIDRGSAFWSDMARSWGFVLLILISIWAYISNKIKANIFMIIALVLVGIDLIPVAKRFLNNKDFVTKAVVSQSVEPNAIDLELEKDKTPSFRIYNITTNPFADARDSYFHKSIGGYHAAKLRRYNELIEAHISKGNMGVMNMLNAKYFIINGQNNVPTLQPNIGALGNAWFVDEVVAVKNADEELISLDKFDPKKIAYVDAKFTDLVTVGKQNSDTSSRISLKSYTPDLLVYESDSKTKQTALFSEIFYRGNQDWISKVDGVVAPHFRADYVLRGLSIPAGKHEITFEFKPAAIYEGGKIDLIASILAFLLLGLAIFFQFKNK